MVGEKIGSSKSRYIAKSLRVSPKRIPLVFPVHPRTRENLRQNGLMSLSKGTPGFYLVKPLNYIRFMNLVFNSRLGITGSGGIQEETTYLRIPCLTMRPNTERSITIQQGTNQLCTPENLEKSVKNILSAQTSKGSIPRVMGWPNGNLGCPIH